MSWHSIKEQIVRTLHSTDDQLHTQFGLLIYVAAAWVFRASPRRWLWALLTVAVVELLNEAVDVLDWFNGVDPANWGNGVWDIANTLFWPAIFTILLTRLRQ